MQGFREGNSQDTLIYFTSSKNTYTHYQDNPHHVQFIYLQSPTLSQDILQLTVNDNYYNSPNFHNYHHSQPEHNSQISDSAFFEVPSDQTLFFNPANSSTNKLTQNVSVDEKSLIQKLFTPFLPEKDSEPYLAERNYNSMRTGQGIEINHELNNPSEYQDDNDDEYDEQDWDYLNNFEDY